MHNINGVAIKGIAACVPKKVESNRNLRIEGLENNRLISVTNIEERRIADNKTCTSDLCFTAAEKVLEELNWDKSEIGVLVFVTQTPDYIMPSTAHILQDRLKLSKNCVVFQINEGCAGYIYGLFNVASLMKGGGIRKGLLLVGDTVSKIVSEKDKSSRPLFGDAGSATALKLDEKSKMTFDVGGDGKSFRDIIIEDGGFRNPFGPNSLKEKVLEVGISRNNTQLVLDGLNVFLFGITSATSTVKKLMAKLNLVVEDVDYFVFHQANKMMIDKICKKLKVPAEKVPGSLNKYGNTSSATIPLTIVSALKNSLASSKRNIVLCGFGIGVSWGSVFLSVEDLKCSEIIEY